MKKIAQTGGVITLGLLILANIIFLIQNFVPYADAQFFPNMPCSEDEEGYVIEIPSPLGGTTLYCLCDTYIHECACCGY
jgi:hypothetical protein